MQCSCNAFHQYALQLQCIPLAPALDHLQIFKSSGHAHHVTACVDLGYIVLLLYVYCIVCVGVFQGSLVLSGTGTSSGKSLASSQGFYYSTRTSLDK